MEGIRGAKSRWLKQRYALKPYLFSLSIIISSQNMLSTLLKNRKSLRRGIRWLSNHSWPLAGPTSTPSWLLSPPFTPPCMWRARPRQKSECSFVLYSPLTLSLPPTFPIHSFTSWHFPFTRSPGGTLVRASRRESMHGMVEMPPRGPTGALLWCLWHFDSSPTHLCPCVAHTHTHTPLAYSLPRAEVLLLTLSYSTPWASLLKSLSKWIIRERRSIVVVIPSSHKGVSHLFY